MKNILHRQKVFQYALFEYRFVAKSDPLDFLAYAMSNDLAPYTTFFNIKSVFIGDVLTKARYIKGSSFYLP
jgi:hypothetical protein